MFRIGIGLWLGNGRPRWPYRMRIDGKLHEKLTDDDTGAVLTDDDTGEPLYDEVTE